MLFSFDKDTVAEVPNEFGVQFRVEGEVEPFEGFLFFEGSPGKTEAEFSGFPAFDFILDKQLEELRVAQGIFLRLVKPEIEAFEKAA
jgi:hypothetical protein